MTFKPSNPPFSGPLALCNTLTGTDRSSTHPMHCGRTLLNRQMARKTVLAQVLATVFGVVTLGVAVPTAVHAQSNATGTVYGNAEAGTLITLTNTDSGAKRTVTVEANGRYSVPSLTTGPYRVEASRGGKPIGTEVVEVKLGQGVEASFSANTLAAVQVIGRRAGIDVSQAGSTSTFTAAQLARIPVASNVASIIQLAPNTVKGDSRYGGVNAPSFGGSGASENAYFINGFPVTNTYVQVGFSQLPYNALAQAQVLTGGYGAEFGRSTGGVVNMVTKSGTNDWVAGFGLTRTPAAFRAAPRNQFYAVTGDPTNAATDGQLRAFHKLDTQSESTRSAYFGGPLIKDKLFIFAAIEEVQTYYSQIRRTADQAVTASGKAAAWEDGAVRDPRFLLKLDWNITDAHRLEFTKLNQDVYREQGFYGFDYATLQRNNVKNAGSTYTNWQQQGGGLNAAFSPSGAHVDILKYTGYLTDNLTLQAIVGRSRTAREQTPDGYNPALAQVVSNAQNEFAAFGAYAHPQSIAGSLLVPGAADSNNGARIDLEWHLNDKHTVRAGLDRNDIKASNGTTLAGGTVFTYGKTLTPGTLLNRFNTRTLASVTGNAAAQAGYSVQQAFTATASAPSTVQNAQYIEDRWQLTDRMLLTLGLRNEGFDNKNGDGETFISLPTQVAPRVAAAWDVKGDKSLKAFFTGGRYHLPVPTNVAVRQLGSSLATRQDFAYSGVDAQGRPTGLTPLSPVYSSNNEFGQAKDFHDYINPSIKSNYQDEIALGFEQAISKSLNWGMKFTYRALGASIDDVCDNRYLVAYAVRAKLPTALAEQDVNCRLFNPGIANEFEFDFDGDGKREIAKVTAAELGFPKSERTYKALDVFFEHPFDGKWYGKLNYTWSRNFGNAEGQLNSDLGQADVAATVSWDFPEVMANTSGLLPNDRTHRIKAHGFYQLDSEWVVGANMLLSSGRPVNCFGNAPNPLVQDPYGYGNVFNYCAGRDAPRGSLGRLPWEFSADFNVSFKPAALKGVTFKADFFNVFNNQPATSIVETREPANSTLIDRNYGAYAYSAGTAPRTVKLSFFYDHKF